MRSPTRYCNQCHKITPGEPLFCNFCGRSYNLKLCPHRHPNPRNAEICSQCGSRDLSMPHPRVPLWLAPLLLILLQFMLVGLMLAFLWYLYMHLPRFLRRLLTRLFSHSQRDDHGH